MSIDWTKPLELVDGTPVKLEPCEWYGGMIPDRDGDYWIIREDGQKIVSADNGGNYRHMCVRPDGCEEGTDIVIVRNRESV